MCNQLVQFCLSAGAAFGLAGGFVILSAQSPCSYGLPVSAASVPTAGGTLAFDLVTQAGCPWAAAGGAGVTSIVPSSGNASGTLTVTVGGSTDQAPRVVDVRIGGLLFLINQAG